MTQSTSPASPGLVTRAFGSRAEMGREAAAAIAHDMREGLARQPILRVMFAAAPSQQDMLESLLVEPGIDWSRVHAFHMDEYIGLPAEAPQRFAAWLDRALFTRLPFGAVNRIDPAAFAGPLACAEDYAARLATAPMDLVCLGIGVNGHLAFNDPPVANFADPLRVKLVELDAVCRLQQVQDECFPDLESVPTHAVTVTIPELMRGRKLHCVVPGAIKREAVRRTLAEDISTACPATILRRHPHCVLYLDPESQPRD